MTAPEWRVRVAREEDAALLADFRCATDRTPWQREVEAFITTALLPWAFDPRAASADPRVLLMLVEEELVGVTGHEHASLVAPDGRQVDATKLEVVALSDMWQGKRFSSDVRASDVLMSAAITDITGRRPPRHTHVYAVVHEENERSLGLLARHGFSDELSRPHPRYRRLVTPAC
jgi:hypothetical protein